MSFTIKFNDLEIHFNDNDTIYIQNEAGVTLGITKTIHGFSVDALHVEKVVMPVLENNKALFGISFDNDIEWDDSGYSTE